MDEIWGRTVTENPIKKTLSKLPNVIEAKQSNNEVWKAENQGLLEQLQQ